MHKDLPVQGTMKESWMGTALNKTFLPPPLCVLERDRKNVRTRQLEGLRNTIFRAKYSHYNPDFTVDVTALTGSAKGRAANNKSGIEK